MRSTLVILSCAAAGTAQDIPAPEDFLDARDVAVAVVEQGLTPGISVAVLQHGELVWAEGFGFADLEKQKRATADTIYDVGWAITEECTRLAVQVAAQRGLFDLDQAANHYLPGNKLRAARGGPESITIRRLLEHEAGLASHWSYIYEGDPAPDMEDVIRAHGFSVWGFERHVPIETPRDLGAGLLAYLTERVAEKPWADFVQTELFELLGMRRTAVGVRPGFEGDAATQYAKTLGGEFVRQRPYRADAPGVLGVRSTVRDLVRLLPDQRLLGFAGGTLRNLAEELRSLVPTDYPGTDLARVASVPGATGVVLSYPRLRAGFAILSNCGDPDAARELRHAVAEAVGLEKPWNAAVGLGGGGEEGLRGTFTGTLSLQTCGADVRLEIPGEKKSRPKLAIGDRSAIWLYDWSCGPTSFRAELDAPGPLPHPSFRGAPRLELHLLLEGEDDLIGVAYAVAPGYFRLPHLVVLSRVE